MPTPTTEATIQQQAPALLSHAVGYASHRTIAMELRAGLIEALAQATNGRTPDELAGSLDLDPYYLDVWFRSALGAGVCQRDGDRYRLTPHMLPNPFEPKNRQLFAETNQGLRLAFRLAK